MTTKLVIFDMDGTLVKPSSSWRVLHRHFGTEDEDFFNLYMARKIDDMEFIRSDVRRWVKVDPDVRLSTIEDVLEGVEYIDGFADVVRALDDRGIRRAMISGGLMTLASRVGADAGLEVILANDVLADDDGRLTGEGVVNVEVRSKGKYVRGVVEKMGLADTPGEVVGVGDTSVDADLFRACDVGIAFNPKDEAVRKGATAVVESDDLRDILPHIP